MYSRSSVSLSFLYLAQWLGMGLPFCRNGALGYHTERVIISFAPYTFPRLIKIVELDRYFFVLQYFFFLYLNLLVPSLPCIYNRIAFFCVSSDFFFFFARYIFFILFVSSDGVSGIFFLICKRGACCSLSLSLSTHKIYTPDHRIFYFAFIFRPISFCIFFSPVF